MTLKKLSPEKRWPGPKPECDICKDKPRLFFVDGSTQSGWAVLCEVCFDIYGLGLGPGVGQKYDAKTLVKIED